MKEGLGGLSPASKIRHPGRVWRFWIQFGVFDIGSSGWVAVMLLLIINGIKFFPSQEQSLNFKPTKHQLT